MSNVVSISNYSPPTIGSECNKMKKELDELEAKFEALCQELFKILHEVIALAASGTPASSPEWAKLGGEIDTITDESNKLSSEIKLLQTQLSYRALGAVHLSPDLMRLLFQQLKQTEKIVSQSEQKLKKISKALVQAVQEIIKTVVSHGTQSNTQVEKMVQQLNQLTNLISQLHDSDPSSKSLSNQT